MKCEKLEISKVDLFCQLGIFFSTVSSKFMEDKMCVVCWDMRGASSLYRGNKVSRLDTVQCNNMSLAKQEYDFLSGLQRVSSDFQFYFQFYLWWLQNLILKVSGRLNLGDS